MRVKHLSRDLRGIEGLPLKLMIVALLVSLTLPVALTSLQGFSERLVSTAIESELDELEGAAISTFLGGPGSVRVVEMDIHMVSSGGSIELGGPRGTLESHSIRFCEGDLQIIRYVDGLPLDISTRDGGSAMLWSPGGSFRMECVSEGDEIWIMVEVIE